MIILETERLLFRDHIPADLEAFCAMEADPIVATVEAGNDASAHILRKLGFSWQRLEPGEQRSYNHFELLNTGGKDPSVPGSLHSSANPP
jgi:RimJ/RimL family protein N-acetyltransferase